MRERHYDLLNIKNDFVFKAVFGREDEECRIILRGLLNAILDLRGSKQIKDIAYKNPFNLKEVQSDKLCIMDIRVETEEGKQIDIELQAREDKDYRQRSLIYWAKLYNGTISEGDAYNQLKQCIVINILDFSLFVESENYHNIFEIKERNEHFVFQEDLLMHFIDLKKFDDNKCVDEMTEIEQWLTFFKDINNNKKAKVLESISKKSEVISMASNVLRKISRDEKLREKHFDLEKARRDQISKEIRAREEGKEEGREEGKEIGIELTIKVIELLNAHIDEKTILEQYQITKEQLKLIIKVASL